MNFGSLYHARLYIGLACSKIVANPGKSLSPRRNCDGLEDREYPRLSDLIDLLNHTSIQVAELAMLSLLLVFKDICPSHRIKLEADEDHLKKVTRRSRYIDKTLLEQYCKFTNFLQLKVDLGLGNTKNTVSRWDAAARLGLSAFRCQCELMKHLYHFNFRSVIMSSVVARGSQPSAKIRNRRLRGLRALGDPLGAPHGTRGLSFSLPRRNTWPQLYSKGQHEKKKLICWYHGYFI